MKILPAVALCVAMSSIGCGLPPVARPGLDCSDEESCTLKCHEHDSNACAAAQCFDRRSARDNDDLAGKTFAGVGVAGTTATALYTGLHSDPNTNLSESAKLGVAISAFVSGGLAAVGAGYIEASKSAAHEYDTGQCSTYIIGD